MSVISKWNVLRDGFVNAGKHHLVGIVVINQTGIRIVLTLYNLL